MSPSISDNTIPEVALDQTTPAVADSTQPSVIGRTNDLFSLGNRTVAITGGGRGLGIVLAGAVIEAGGDVVCLDLLPAPSAEEWASVQKLATARRLHASYVSCDITDEASTKQVLEQIAADALSRKMPLRGLITCAGIQQMVPALEYPVDMWRKMLDVNVIGTFIPAKHCARIFKEQNTPASIVMIASMSGQIANRGLTCTAYNSSKAAVHQMCRSVAQEWGQYGIRINTLSAGYIRTAMTDALLAEKPEVEETWMRGALLGRLGVPEDFKAPTVYMLADGSGFMTGADLRVDGGHCASA
ncbi:oxidoreductase, short chain dehydrogenase/reductase family [Aspergillus homomorphus CBS 101889]|uniref:Oxidoreductase n=1 Tax=Aspergillus homomorphus (strain CBS 101889) TaxID=1450537 RepID=A0A395HUL8_ASPHC|nr:oxidoreductase [Aspergillus homomorphus CBS 101889]RAL11085.1 oxidoreductase [Aspergillus homomorphus CBS 101889]